MVAALAIILQIYNLSKFKISMAIPKIENATAFSDKLGSVFQISLSGGQQVTNAM